MSQLRFIESALSIEFDNVKWQPFLSHFQSVHSYSIFAVSWRFFASVKNQRINISICAKCCLRHNKSINKVPTSVPQSIHNVHICFFPFPPTQSLSLPGIIITNKKVFFFWKMTASNVMWEWEKRWRGKQFDDEWMEWGKSSPQKHCTGSMEYFICCQKNR